MYLKISREAFELDTDCSGFYQAIYRFGAIWAEWRPE
jgi:hypothetical protein